MPDETYLNALRASLKTFRTVATLFGRIQQRDEEAWNTHDVDEALHWEQVWAKSADDRGGIALSLLLAAFLLEEAGARVPNPRWVTPPWLCREWQAMCEEQKEP